MNTTLKAGLAATLAAAAGIAFSTASLAADLWGGSLKDGGYYAPAQQATSLASNCYARADLGYSWNGSPRGTYVGNAGGASPDVRGSRLDDGLVSEVGFGCGSGSRGFRADLTLGFRADRDYHGDVDIFVFNPIDPPIKTTLDTYTVMLNGYYDFGNFRGFVPYVGMGLGLALHDMGYVTIDHPLSPNPQHGDTRAQAVWSLMAGVAYQLSPNAILDFGYRYIDLGSARSNQGDTALAMNPKLVLTEMEAHEFKVGVRYHFDQAASSCCSYSTMK